MASSQDPEYGTFSRYYGDPNAKAQLGVEKNNRNLSQKKIFMTVTFLVFLLCLVYICTGYNIPTSPSSSSFFSSSSENTGSLSGWVDQNYDTNTDWYKAYKPAAGGENNIFAAGSGYVWGSHKSKDVKDGWGQASGGSAASSGSATAGGSASGGSASGGSAASASASSAASSGSAASASASSAAAPAAAMAANVQLADTNSNNNNMDQQHTAASILLKVLDNEASDIVENNQIKQ